MKRILLSGIIVLLTMQSCFQIFESSGNSIISETILDNKYKAVGFYKPGNATTKNSVHVSIIPIDKKIGDEESGNCFVAETNSGQHNNIAINREMNGQLEIVFKDKLEIIKSKSFFITENDTIQIKYIP